MSDLKKYTDYKTILSVNALIWCEGKVLLLKRAATKKVDPGVYSGIGGKVEPGEDILSAMYREIEEEVGITKEQITSIKPYSVTQHPYPPHNAEWVNVYFYARVNEQFKIEPTEDGEFEWRLPEEVSRLPMVNDLPKYIEILDKNPEAFILGFFNFDKQGDLVETKIEVFD